MDRVDLEAFERDFERAIAEDDDNAARALLAAGQFIYVSHDDTPPGYVVRILPDGGQEPVRVDYEQAAAILGR